MRVKTRACRLINVFVIIFLFLFVLVFHLVYHGEGDSELNLVQSLSYHVRVIPMVHTHTSLPLSGLDKSQIKDSFNLF